MSTLETTPIENSARCIGEAIENTFSAITDALESTDVDNDLVDHVDEQGSELATVVENEITTLVDHVDENSSEIDDIQDNVDGLEDDVNDVEDDVEDHDRRLDASSKWSDSIENRIVELEDRIEGHDPKGSDEQTALHDDATPIERLTVVGEEAISENVTASVERAVTLFENYRDWAVSTPQGRVLKSGDGLKKLLETARDESLAWKQVYRACQCLERLSKGRIVFFNHDRHGKMLKQHDEFVIHSGSADDASLSSSSATT